MKKNNFAMGKDGPMRGKMMTVDVSMARGPRASQVGDDRLSVVLSLAMPVFCGKTWARLVLLMGYGKMAN